jgi:REP element-mobilizing transposase RayT
MRHARWLAPWKDSLEKRAIYHCVSRVVDRRFVLGDEEREHFRMFMRMQENFSGCRVLAYCVMSNHFHLLLEIPPASAVELDDEGLLKRLSTLYSEAFVAMVAKELAEARAEQNDGHVAEIYARFTYRMHNLSEFMKTLLQRFTSWFNRTHQRRGTLWEQRYKSVIVESGDAARTMAAYIDLNPVRAGMVSDPAEYRWSSYGEAIGGGTKGNGKKARIGLMRACIPQNFKSQISNLKEDKNEYDTEKWKETSRVYRRVMGLALGRKKGNAKLGEVMAGENMNDEEMIASRENGTLLPDLGMAKMLRMRVRYFTDGAVIGSKAFVNEAFAASRDRFSDKRKDGARKMRGVGKGAEGTLWSVRDLRVGV